MRARLAEWVGAVVRREDSLHIMHVQVRPSLRGIRDLGEQGADARRAVYELVVIDVEDVRVAGGACTWDNRRDVRRLAVHLVEVVAARAVVVGGFDERRPWWGVEEVGELGRA